MKLLCLVIALVLSTAFALHSRGQSQEPPKTERVQTDQGATADKGKSDQPAGQADNPQPIVPEVKAPVLKKEPGGRGDHSAEETSEYWPFLFFGTRLKINGRAAVCNSRCEHVMKVGHHLPMPFRAALPNAIFKDRLCHKHAPRGAGGSATGLSATGRLSSFLELPLYRTCERA